MDGDLLEDNPSFVEVLTSSGIMRYFPLLRAIGCSGRSPSCTSLPSSRLFFT